jgi:large subunit ribosomal protein L31
MSSPRRSKVEAYFPFAKRHFFGQSFWLSYQFFMKAGVHPDYNDTTIICACGAAYKTRSTKDNIKIGICSACHPYFTGEQKFIDTAGRIEKFTRRYGNVRATRATKPKLAPKA